ncbi:MAG: DMP19 family protein [Aureispira sp.]
MPIYSLSDLHPIYEHTAKEMSPTKVAAYPLVARTIYWAMRIDGELKNGGIAQLIWNLHESYDYEVLYKALEEIGAKKAQKLLQKGVDYIYKTEKRQAAFFAKGPFGAAKPLQKITDNYYNLAPSVSAQLLEYVEDKWSDKVFQKLVKELDLTSILKVEFTTEEVFDAVYEANIRLLQQMLAAGLDPNIKNDRGTTLLMECLGNSSSPNQRKKITKLLVETGADIEATNEHGETVLNSICSYGGNRIYLQCLVELGSDIEHKGLAGRTPVFGLIQRAKNLEYFISIGANVHYKTANGFTPFSSALSGVKVWTENTTNQFKEEFITAFKESIQVLLDNGVGFSTEPVGQFKETELSYLTGDTPFMKKMMEHPSFKEVPEWTMEKGPWTALHQASQAGHTASLRTLLEAGMNPNGIVAFADLEKLVFAGAKPLDLARNKSVEKLLLEYGAEKGVPTSYALYLKTRGTYPKKLAAIIASAQDCSLEEGVTIVENLPKKEGEHVEWDKENNLSVYKESLLQTYSSKEEAQKIITSLTTLNIRAQIV